jgi:hypothetical protein
MSTKSALLTVPGVPITSIGIRIFATELAELITLDADENELAFTADEEEELTDPELLI